VRGYLLQTTRVCSGVSVLTTVVVCLLLGSEGPEARAASNSYIDFGRYDTYGELSVAEQDGVTVGKLAGEAGEVILTVHCL
jgi:hypothetical protein